MRVVHKFRLEYPGTPSIVQMDPNGIIVRVALQWRTVQLWAEVDPNAKKVDRVFHTYGTGEPINRGEQWIGTYTVEESGFQYVWHVYEVK